MQEQTLAFFRQQLAHSITPQRWGELIRYLHALPNEEKPTARSYLRKHLHDHGFAHCTRAQIFEEVLQRKAKDFFFSIWQEKDLEQKVALYQEALSLATWVSFPELRPKPNKDDYGSFSQGPIPLPSTLFWNNFRPYCGEVSTVRYSSRRDVFAYIDIGATGGQTYTADIAIWNPLGPANFIQGGIWDLEGQEFFFSPCGQFISLRGIDFDRRPRHLILSTFGQRLFEWRPTESKIRDFDIQKPHRYVKIDKYTQRFYSLWETRPTPPKRLLALDQHTWLELRNDNSLWKLRQDRAKLREEGPLHPDLPIVDITVTQPGCYALCCATKIPVLTEPTPFDDPNFDDPNFDWEGYLEHMEALEEKPVVEPDYTPVVIYTYPDEQIFSYTQLPTAIPPEHPLEYYGPKAPPCFVGSYLLLRPSENSPMFLWNPWP